MKTFPRASLAHLPTPLEPMPRLSAHLNGPPLYVKRDDCTGLAMGGNKARQIEYYLGEALAQGADTVLITGAVQSNFVRQVAAGACKLGLNCHVQLENRVADMPAAYHESGNVLLNRIFGATIHHFPVGEDEAAADRNLEKIAREVEAAGGRPYIIPLGADHPPLGAVGYMDAAGEILDQARGMGVGIGAFVTASGSAVTHAGLLTGLRHRGCDLPVAGICVRRDAVQQSARVLARCRDLERLAGLPARITESDVWTTDAYLGPSYGKPTPQMFEAVRLAARLEGLLVDPVYTGKVFAGAIGLVRDGTFSGEKAVVVLHTGGTPALFGYAHLFEDGWDG
ncbi:MAG: D-cysteine desulfhydrase family protein [Hyphomicrobiales bacterium]|nr:D-cysteine desulfhydrase family protein [Hyphomicrobiales bacterium]